MFGIENYFGFLIGGILLNLTPGSDTIYILTRSISQGKKAGVYSVLGISTGGLSHTFFTAFGLSIILSTSAVAFNIVKIIGALYLVYLGIKMLTDKSNIFANNELVKRNSMTQIYLQGFLTNLFNPKVALFFLSFLPQFINTTQSKGPIPFLILGITFVTTGTIWCLILAYSSSLMTRTLRENVNIGKYLQKISGVIFLGLGLKLALKNN
jgi:threonine/homoserine/homoserine lactone efflux protein